MEIGHTLSLFPVPIEDIFSQCDKAQVPVTN